MLIRVKLFAAMRDLTGDEVVEADVPDGATVGDLRRELGKILPLARSLLQRSAVAVNRDVAENEAVLQPTDEVAVIPPVSGG